MPEKYLFNNKKLELSIPDNPENLFWENMEYSNKSRRIKLFIIVIGVILLIAVSFIINMSLSAYSESSETKSFRCNDAQRMKYPD